MENNNKYSYQSYYDFHNGFAIIDRGGDFPYNFINEDNKIISKRWFKDVWDFDEDGFAAVEVNRGVNFINTKGRIISEEYFDAASKFYNGLARVKLNGKWNYINTKGKLISEEWYDFIDKFDTNGLAIVFKKIKNDRYEVIDRKCNVMNTNGQILSPDQWFDCVEDFHNGLARVQKDGKCNFINTNGKLISEEWYDIAGVFSKGKARVRKDGKWFEIMYDGETVNVC